MRCGGGGGLVAVEAFYFFGGGSLSTNCGEFLMNDKFNILYMVKQAGLHLWQRGLLLLHAAVGGGGWGEEEEEDACISPANANGTHARRHHSHT